MLLVLEGIDGTGKTTIARRLAALLQERGLAVVEAREPTSETEAGRRLRALLAQKQRQSTPERELALFHADRTEHVQNVILPALDAGRTVVQDRTFYSTAAYQGALGLDVDRILRDSRSIAPNPDLVLWLALAPKQALERISQSRESFDSFERLEYLERVHEIYRQLAAREANFATIDAARGVEAVLREALEICERHGVTSRPSAPPQ